MRPVSIFTPQQKAITRDAEPEHQAQAQRCILGKSQDFRVKAGIPDTRLELAAEDGDSQEGILL